MEALFLKLLNMSITASWMILAVIVLRVALKNAPKFIRCILWGLVAIRLICPISFESVLSLVPSTEVVTKQAISSGNTVNYNVSTGINTVDSRVNEYLGENYHKSATVTNVPVKESISTMEIISVVWFVGVVVMALYSIMVYVRIRHKVAASIHTKDNIWICDNIESPFILGIFSPHIYIPSNISEQESKYVISHEKAHLMRLDYIWKPLGFLILSVYWFNPFIWVAYVLLCRDIELACDERVIQYMNVEDKKEYSRTLLACSVSHKMIAACPVAFGEVAVGRRVKSVLNYKKPAFWVLTIAIVACGVVAVCFLTNPKTYADDNTNVNESTDNNEVEVIKKENGEVVENEDTIFTVDTDDVNNIFGTDEKELTFAYVDEERGCIYQIYLNTVEETFKMTYDVTLSYCRASGSYTIEGNKIILTDSDEPEEYVFDIVDGQLVFNEPESTEMPLYAHDLNEKTKYIWIGRTSDETFDKASYERYSNDSNYEIVRLTNDGYVFRNDIFTDEERELQLLFFNESFKEGIVDWSYLD